MPIKFLYLVILFVPNLVTQFIFAQNWTVKDVKATSDGCNYLRENANVIAYVSDGYGETKSNGSHLYIKNPKSNKHSFYYMGTSLGQGEFRELKSGEEIEIYLARYVTNEERDKPVAVYFVAKFIPRD